MRKRSLRVSGLVIATVLTLAYAPVALAQQPGTPSSEGQYGKPSAPSGPASGATCVSSGAGNGVVNAGDVFTFSGGFAASPGASVVLQDFDGTQGTLIDGKNATITSKGGSLKVAVTGAPVDVSGGNSTLSDNGCKELVASTGVAPAQTATTKTQGTASSGGEALSVLPNTSGPMLTTYLAVLAAAGVGIVYLRRLIRRRSR